MWWLDEALCVLATVGVLLLLRPPMTRRHRANIVIALNDRQWRTGAAIRIAAGVPEGSIYVILNAMEEEGIIRSREGKQPEDCRLPPLRIYQWTGRLP